MNKQWTLVIAAGIGVVAVATWSVAQSPKDSASPRSAASAGDGGKSLPQPKSRLSVGGASSPAATRGSGPATSTTSARQELDPSLAPFRGSDYSRSESLPSPSSSGMRIRIDPALVTSLDPIKLPARDAGAIREFTAKKGVDVKAGDILGQLDDREATARLKIAEKERDAAQVQAENTAQIEAAEKGELVTRENLKANDEIRSKSPGALSDFEYRRSRFDWERSIAQIAVAKMEKSVAEATQLAKEAQIEAALIEIERRKIVAPIDGFVNEVYKHRGEWCQPGDPVLELVRMDRLEIEGFVNAPDVSPAQVLGKPVEVIVQLAGGETYKATSKITFASPVLEGSGRIRQFRVSTEIDNKKVTPQDGEPYWLIQPGTEAEMTIDLNTPAPKPVIAPKPNSPTGAKSGIRGSKSGLPGNAVEVFKPADDAAAKSDDKAKIKSDAKGSKASDSKTEKDAKDSPSSDDLPKPAEKGKSAKEKASQIKL